MKVIIRDFEKIREDEERQIKLLFGLLRKGWEGFYGYHSKSVNRGLATHYSGVGGARQCPP